MAYESYEEVEITPTQITPPTTEEQILRRKFYARKLPEFRKKIEYLRKKGLKKEEREQVLRKIARKYSENFRKKYAAYERLKKRHEQEKEEIKKKMESIIRLRTKIQEKLKTEKLSTAEKMSLEKQLEGLANRLKRLREFYASLGYSGLI